MPSGSPLGYFARRSSSVEREVAHDLELEEAGLAEDVRHARHARDLDQDAVGALARDHGLGDARARVVDAPAQDLERLEHRPLAHLLDPVRGEREGEVVVARAAHLEALVVREERAHAIAIGGARGLHQQALRLEGESHAGDLLVFELALERALDARQLVADRGVEIRTDHDVDPAAQVEAEPHHLVGPPPGGLARLLGHEVRGGEIGAREGEQPEREPAQTHLTSLPWRRASWRQPPSRPGGARCACAPPRRARCRPCRSRASARRRSRPPRSRAGRRR